MAEGEGAVVEAQPVDDGGKEVGLLDDALRHTALGVAGVEDDHGDAVPAVVAVVLGRDAGAAVVGGDDEDGVGEPGLAAGLVEELAEGVVHVFHALEDGVGAFDETVLVLVGEGEGVVAGDGEDGGEEGLAEGVGAAHDVLQEGFVVDAPHAVEVLRTALGVGLELVLAEVFLVADALAYLVEVHHAVVAAVEESGVVAVAVEYGGNALDAVVAIGAVDEGDVHPGGDAGVDGGDALDGTFAVGTALIYGAIARQRVEEGGAGVGAGLVVVDAAVFLSEAFHDDEHHVGRQGAEAVGGGVEHGGRLGSQGDVFGGEELVGGALGHVFVPLQLRAHEGADDVVAAVAHQGYVLRLAVAGGVLGLDEGAEAAAHEEPHHEQSGAKADQLVGHHGVGVALGEAYAMVDDEEGHDYEDAEDEGVPIVHHEVGYHLVHRAAVAEVGEDFVGEHVVGVLVVGRVGGTCHQKEQHRKHVEHLGEDPVPPLPTGFGGQQHQQGEWRQHHADRCQSEHQVAPNHPGPFAEGLEVEDMTVGGMEEYLHGLQRAECKQQLVQQVDVCVMRFLFHDS